MQHGELPQAQGLYDPQHEKDACGVGFVAHIRGRRSHDIVRKGLQLLCNLEHRGASGSEVNTGDGAGILIQMPDAFFRARQDELGFALPPAGDYGVASCFLSRDRMKQELQMRTFADIVRHHNQKVIGWRDVPVNVSAVGAMGRRCLRGTSGKGKKSNCSRKCCGDWICIIRPAPNSRPTRCSTRWRHWPITFWWP